MRLLRQAFVASILLVTCLTARDRDAAIVTANAADSVIWRHPTNISARDLFYGAGGREHAPVGPFTFVEEDLGGTNPKFVVTNPKGIRWTVKLGPEVKPETAATRIVWAAGYFANEVYYLEEIQVRNLPARLRRGQSRVKPNGVFHGVRLKRHLTTERKLGNWAWSENPFSGTREFNGLRVVMSLLNNWDLTDENNAVYEELEGPQKGQRRFMVSDVGSTFGTGKLSWPMKHCRGDVDAFGRSTFLSRLESDHVDLHAPAGASLFFLATPREYRAKARIKWIGDNIPRRHAQWIGQVLAALSPKQVRDAFRAAGYLPEEVEGFAATIERRIAELRRL
jgi:hypothetical protein